MTSTGAATRLAAYYAAVFGAIGIQMPFWPLWLSGQGLSAGEIGWIIAATYLVKFAVNPVVGHVVDRRGDRRRPMTVMAGAATIAWGAFAFVDGFWPILAVTILSVGLWVAILPVGESLAMMTTSAHRLDYGRVRLWGSLAFIATATGVGRLLVEVSTDSIMWLIAAALAATAVACVFLPDIRVERTGAPPAPLMPLLRSPAFLLFLAAASLNTAGHTVYYGFATLHWKAAGISDATIGLLWSEGVLAEIVLFAFSGHVVRRLGPAGLLMVAGAGGALRWLVLGLSTDVAALASVQMLHAATFGCAHLGAMHFIQRAVPADLSARAQGLYAALAMGLAPGLMSPLTGWLYGHVAGGAFLAMTLFAAATMAAAWALLRRWQGGTITG